MSERFEDAGRPLTVEEYERLPANPDCREELVRGMIVREAWPGMRHGWLQARLAARLAAFASQDRRGTVVTDVGVVLSEVPSTVRAPDIAFVARERLPAGEPPVGYLRIMPDLAVEIVSPSNMRRAVREKVGEYLAAGIACVWEVDPRDRTVTVRLGDGAPRVFGLDDVLEGDGPLAGFLLPLAELFAPD